MSIEIFDTDGERITELASVTRKGVNRAYWTPNMKPPRAPKTEAIPFQMFFAFQGPDYPAGEYKVKVSKGKEIYESSIRVYNNPDMPHTEEDLALRRKTILQGYQILEDLAYLDQRMNDVIGQTSKMEESPELKSSQKKKITALNSELESVKDRLMVRNYGDLRGDAELREKIGFLYGTVIMYPGSPTNSQIKRMNELGIQAEAMKTEVDGIFSEYLDGLNAQLEKAGLETVTLTTREEFDAEKK